MARIFILTPTLISADAVGNDVLGMHRVLRRRGHEVHLFADDWNVHGLNVRHAYDALSLEQNWDDILIYHHSIGWNLGNSILQNSRCRTIVKYHNVTPAEFFEGISEPHRWRCLEGRSQLTSIARAGHALYLSASAYNMKDLLAAGAGRDRTFVMAPFNEIENLESLTPDLEILDKYSDSKVNLLMVGSVRPNKGHVGLIEAFARYYYDFDCNSRLFIVGAESDDLAGYSQKLRELIELLCLDGTVVFAGQVSPEALKAYYLLSHAFLIASEHEGFCVPLAEAMSMKLPVVGYATAAIDETIGDAGIIWNEREPSLLAESINLLREDESTSVRLGAAGYDRYQEKFSNAVIEDQFLHAARAVGLEL